MKTRHKKRSSDSEDAEDEDWKAEGGNSKSEDDDSEEEPERVRSKKTKKQKVKAKPLLRQTIKRDSPLKRHSSTLLRETLRRDSPQKRDPSSLIKFVEKNRLPNLPRLPFTERLFSSRNEPFSLNSRLPVNSISSASQFLKSRGILSESSILITNPMAKRIKSENIEEVTLDDDDDDGDTDSAFESASDVSKDCENDQKPNIKLEIGKDIDISIGKIQKNAAINNANGKIKINVEKANQNEPDVPNNVRDVYKNVLIRLQSRLKSNNSDSNVSRTKKEKENIVQEAYIMLDDIFKGMQMETIENSEEPSDEESKNSKKSEKNRLGKLKCKESDSIPVLSHENLATLQESNKRLQEIVSSKRKTIEELTEKFEMVTSREEKLNKNLSKESSKNKEQEKHLATALKDVDFLKKQLDEMEAKSVSDAEKLSTLETETAKAAELIFDFNCKNNKLAEENQRLSQEIEKLKTSKHSFSSIESYYRKIKESYLRCNENLSDTDKENENLTNAIINVFEKFNNTVKDTKIKQGIRDEISKQYESAYRKLAENKDNEIDALNAEINVLKSSGVSTDPSGLREKMISMEKEKQVYQTKAKFTIENMKKEFLSLQQDVKTAIDNNIRRDEQIAKLNKRLKDSDIEINMYKQKLNESQDKLKSINNPEASNLALQNEFTHKIKELEDRCFRADQTIQKMNIQMSSFQANSNEIVRKESEQFRERIRMLEEELKKYEREKVELQKESFDTKKRASEFSVKMKDELARIKALSMEVQNDKVDELEKTLSKLRQENEQLKDENKKSKVRISALEEEADKFKKFDLPLE